MKPEVLFKADLPRLCETVREDESTSIKKQRSIEAALRTDRLKTTQETFYGFKQDLAASIVRLTRLVQGYLKPGGQTAPFTHLQGHRPALCGCQLAHNGQTQT